jgi:mono/diheme cytochrome c family protein
MSGGLFRLGGCVAAILLAASTLAQPAVAADAQNGEALAKRWCASCHLVAPDQQTASADAAPFATVGRTPGFSAEKLALFLLAPHPKMPDLQLSRREAADLAAYIAKLGR